MPYYVLASFGQNAFLACAVSHFFGDVLHTWYESIQKYFEPADLSLYRRELAYWQKL